MKDVFYITIFMISFISLNLKAQIQIITKPIHLGHTINSSSEEVNPLLSPDGNTLFFVRTFADENVGGKLAGQDIWYSRREGGISWGIPKNLTELNTEFNNVVVGLSQSDSIIYLLNTYSSPLRWNFGIAYSTFENEVWSNPKELNLKFKVRNAFRGYYMAPTEDVLLVSMESKDSYGNEDIYIYYKQGKKWHGPIHLNEKVNTDKSEISPFLSADQKTLFFSSEGHGGYGGMDIFMSERLDSTWTNWSEPVNLGAEINSLNFDAYFSTYDKGESFFVSNKEITSNIYYTVIDFGKDEREVKHLIGINLNQPLDNNNETEIEEIITKSFSFTSDVPYHFDVIKLSKDGNVRDTAHLELSPNVQYNFNKSEDQDRTLAYANALEAMLYRKHGMEKEEENKEVVDITLLSKHLDLKEGETYFIDLKPAVENPIGHANFTTEEDTYNLNSDEPKRIILEVDNLDKMSVQTDLGFLESQPEEISYNIAIDTTGFFEENQTPIVANNIVPTIADQQSSTVIDNKASVMAENKVPTVDKKINYRVQIAAYKRKLSDQELKKIYAGDKEIKMNKEEGLYKYYIADEPTYFHARKALYASNIKDAFIVAYTPDSEKVSLQNAISFNYKEQKQRQSFIPKGSVLKEFKVHFELDQFMLESETCSYLDENIIAPLKQNTKLLVIINGHTDIRGSNSYNYILSQARASFVKDYLLQKGINESRVSLQIFGETRTIEECDKFEEDCEEHIHEANRRVEILLTSIGQ